MKRIMRIGIIVFLFSALTVFILTAVRKHSDSVAKTFESNLYISHITIASVGDIFLHSSNIQSGKKDSEYDFEYSFEYIKPLIKTADIATCWFGGVADSIGPYTGYPCFKSPHKIIDAIKNSGFDVLMRTNHTYDYFENGLKSTTSFIKSRNLIQLGAFIDEDESEKIYTFTKDSLTIAILSYTYGTNGLIPKNKWEITLIDTAKIRSDIIKSKKISDFTIVMLHYGTEYSRYPDSFQKRIARFSAEAGADLIIGSHPHVVEPVETLITSDGRIVKSAYSLGNFYCGQRKKYTDTGIILYSIIEKSSRTKGIAVLNNISVTPTYIHRWYDNGFKFLVIPIKDYESKKIPFMDDSTRTYMKYSYEETMKLLGICR